MKANVIAGIKQDWDAERQRMQRAEHPSEFPTLPEIAAVRYISADFYQREQKYLWPKTWLIAGHTDELPSTGG